MTLEELKQVKADFDNGIMVSRATWARVLDAAIEAKTASTQNGEWLSYDGGGCPVDGMDRVGVLLRSGYCPAARKAKDWDWSIDGGQADIIQYRVMP